MERVDSSNGKVRIVWEAASEKTAKVEGCCLVKVVRLCYGEEQRVGTAECAWMVAMMERAELMKSARKSVWSAVVEWTKKTSASNAACGVAMLRGCVDVEQQAPAAREENEETTAQDKIDGMDVCELEKELIKQVLNQSNVLEHWDVVVVRGLMELPARFLKVCEFGAAHTPHSKFAAHRLFVLKHGKDMSNQEKRALMQQCDLNDLDETELMQLSELGVMSCDELLCVLCRALWTKSQQLNAMQEQMSMMQQQINEMQQKMNAVHQEHEAKEAKQNNQVYSQSF